MKSIVQALIKDERAEPFLYPVDKKYELSLCCTVSLFSTLFTNIYLFCFLFQRVFPDYYDVIKNPQDLNTIKTKLQSGSFSSLLHCLSDLRAIWNNCISFNADGSDISRTAKELTWHTEDLILVSQSAYYIVFVIFLIWCYGY